jgi:hypothetical protein
MKPALKDSLNERIDRARQLWRLGVATTETIAAKLAPFAVLIRSIG